MTRKTKKEEDAEVIVCIICIFIIIIGIIIWAIITWWYIILPAIAIIIIIIYFKYREKKEKGIDVTKLYGETEKVKKKRMADFKATRPFDKSLYDLYIKSQKIAKTYPRICPNCKTKLNAPNKCELCGWVKIYTDRPIDKPKEVYKEKRSRRISQRVKNEVWRRDQGKCAKCGSRLNLEYDHIIPFSKGGSNTARNIELLCEKCNRKKYNNI